MHAVGTLLAALSYASRARVAAPSAQSFFTSAIAFFFYWSGPWKSSAWSSWVPPSSWFAWPCAAACSTCQRA